MMRPLALVALVLTVGAACSSFGADTSSGGGNGSDGGGVPPPTPPSTEGGATAFCATANAKFCEDFDGPSPLTAWQDKSTGGTYALVPASSPASAPNALAFDSPPTPNAGACDDRGLILRDIAEAQVSKLTFEAKYHLTAASLDVAANGGPSFELYESISSGVSCTFYLHWDHGEPVLYVDRVGDDGGRTNVFGSVPLAPGALDASWHHVVVTLAPTGDGTEVNASVDGTSIGKQMIGSCSGTKLTYVQLEAGCINAVNKPFHLELDDIAVRW